MSRASTSRGRGSSQSSGGRSRDAEQQDLMSLLLEPDALELIRENRLKLVPIDQEDPSVPCTTCEDFQLVRDERDSLRDRLADRDIQVTDLRRRVIELEEDVVARSRSSSTGQLRRQLDAANSELEELQVRLLSQGDSYNELQDGFQRELENERGRREEAERIMEEERRRREEAERKLEENWRVAQTKLRDSDVKLQEKERVLQENMARDRNRIIVLSNEKEGITQERFKFSGFARQVKILLGYRDRDGDDLLNGQLERIVGEIKKLKEYKNKDVEEMNKKTELIKTIYKLIGDANVIEGGGGRGIDVQSSFAQSPSSSSLSSSPMVTSYFRINSEANSQSLFLSKNPTPPPSSASSTASVPPTPPSTPVSQMEIPTTSGYSAGIAVHPAAIRLTADASPSPLSPNLAEPLTNGIIANAPPQENVAMNISSPSSSPAPAPPGVATIPSLSSPSQGSSSSSSEAFRIPQGPPSSPNDITIINSYSLASASSSKSQPEVTVPSSSETNCPPPPPPSPAVTLPTPPPPSPVIPTLQPLPPPPINTKPSKRAKNPHFNRHGQLTEYSASTKIHGVNKACAKFQCLCGNKYNNEKSLNVHIRKMKTAWKYKCNKCLHYFFYKSDLTRHLARSSKCSESSNGPDGSASFLNDTLFDELIGVRGPSVAPPPQPPGVAITPSSSTTVTAMQLTISSGTRQGTFAKYRNQGKRKLQQEILKRKRHAPWVSKNGAVQGSWYCVCGSKFGLRASMQTHVQYFTQDWKFRCDLCQETFLYLAYLKKHMMGTHKIKGALKEYIMGCQLCGSLFKKRSDYYRHRKIIHNLIRKRPGTLSSTKSTVPPTPAPPKSPEKSIPLPLPLPTNPYAIPLHPPPSITILPIPEPQPGPSGVTPKVEPMEIIDVPSDDDEDIQMIPLSPPPVAVKQERAPSPSPSTYSSVSSAESVESSASGEGQNHGQVESDPLYVDASNPNAQLFSCECGKAYKSRSALGLHIKTMKFGNIYVCMTCSKGFRQLINLKNHMSCVHRDVYRGFYCGLCKMQFTSSRLFKIHRLKAHDN